MTNEERDIIERFIARFGGSAPQQPGQPPLPPIDPEADAHIRTQVARYPEALYRLVQSAFVQEAALGQMKQRLERLQWELEQAQQTQQAQPAQQPARGGFLGGLFGGGASAAPQQTAYQPPPYNPPQPQYAPGMAQPGMVQAGSSGFLGSALTTAAGVAGGLVVGNALMDLFSGPHGGMGGMGGGFGGFGGGFGGQAPVEETIVNNYNAAPSDQWGAGQGVPDQGNGYWSKDDVYQNAGTAQPDQAWTDSGNGGDGNAADWSDNGGGNDDWS
jgi:hypothetical protein